MKEFIQIGALVLRDTQNGKATQRKNLYATKTKELEQAEKNLQKETMKFIKGELL